MKVVEEKLISKEKASYLTEFKRERAVVNDFFGDEVISASEEIVEILKEKRLTYDDAYASLQMSYNTLKFESNFTQLPNQ